MTSTAAAVLAELINELSRQGTDAADDRALERVLERIGKLELRPESVDPVTLGTAIGLLTAARQSVEADLAAINRQRFDVDRTVKAITAYVRALS